MNPFQGKASIRNTPNLFCLCITLTSGPLDKPGHQREQLTCMQQRLLHFYPCRPPQRDLGWETCISPFPADENSRAC